jgi:hypothetical protein
MPTPIKVKKVIVVPLIEMILSNFDGLVKSRKMAIFENSHLIITTSYRAAFGNFI